MERLIIKNKKNSKIIAIDLDDELSELYHNNENEFLRAMGELYKFKVHESVIPYNGPIKGRIKCHNLAKEMEEKEMWFRVCDHCGKLMSEGYYLGGEYACSDECCLALYDGDKEQMEEDLSHYDEEDAECYYTEWESSLNF